MNRFFKAGGRLAGEIATRGAWFDLNARRVKAPPQALNEAMLRMVRSERFEQL